MGLAFPHIWAKGFDSFAQGRFAKLLWVREQMCFCTRVIKSFLLFLGHSRVIRKCLFWVRGWTGFLVGIWIISRAEVESSRFGCSLLTTQGLPEFLMCDTDPQCHRPTWPRSASGTVMNIKLMLPAVLWGINCLHHLDLLFPHWSKWWKPGRPTWQLQ